MSDGEHDRGRFPLIYTGALAGLIATTSVVLFCCFLAFLVVALHWTPQGQLVSYVAYFFSPIMLASFSFPAVAVMILATAPIDGVVRKIRSNALWPYILATTCIVGLCYLLLFRLDPRADGLAVLIPVASIPCGLFLYYLIRPIRRPEPVDNLDIIIIATWCAAWLWSWNSLPTSPYQRLSVAMLDPMAARQAIAGQAAFQGLPIFMMIGIIAGVVRVWHLRIGAILAALAWLVPATFAIVYFVTPLGPDTYRLTAGRQQFDIDWRLNPRKTSTGFCVHTSGSSYITGSPNIPIGQGLCLSAITEPLTPPLADIPDPSRSNIDGLSSEQHANLRRACHAQDDHDRITALIVCHYRDCLYEFEDHGLRISFHIGPGDIADWRKMRERAVRFISQLGVRAA